MPERASSFCIKISRNIDPACKTGVFLREIAKRLLEGLKEEILDEEERRNHVFTKQLFGIAITEITALLSRRSLYCSKFANGRYSIVPFDRSEGNIRFKNLSHYWVGDRCGYCGASKLEYDRSRDLEQHAYEFIHTIKPEDILNMKFDVIIGNPPYHLSDGGDSSEGARIRGGAIPIYHHFVQQAMKLNPRYLSMIIPSRWFSGGRGLDNFRRSMIEDDRIREIHDYVNASDCFPGVDIKGGICYFKWDRENRGTCSVNTYVNNKLVSTMERPLVEEGNDTFIRYNNAITILHKIKGDL